jgi:hypothetical protein
MRREHQARAAVNTVGPVRTVRVLRAGAAVVAEGVEGISARIGADQI